MSGPEPRPRMTLRVYRVAPDGTVTDEKPEARVMEGEPVDASPLALTWPECRCLRHGSREMEGR